MDSLRPTVKMHVHTHCVTSNPFLFLMQFPTVISTENS